MILDQGSTVFFSVWDLQTDREVQQGTPSINIDIQFYCVL